MYGDSPYPGRIPLPGAINFLLFGTALLALDLRWGDRRPAQWLLLAVGAIALMVIIGYAYDVASLYRPPLTPPVPLHGMILFGASGDWWAVRASTTGTDSADRRR